MSDARLIRRVQYDALLLDLDGVITDTAGVHAKCWKRTFDDYLAERAEDGSTSHRPFDISTDYVHHVDGKPRYDGVRDFLRSRGISLPEGVQSDPPDAATVCGLGNRKNVLVNEAIGRGEVRAFSGSVKFLRAARELNFRTAVVTSSRNREAVLQAAGLQSLFDAAVDGNLIADRRMAGKPAPDAFLEAARQLDTDPARAVVFEDAIAGVQAGARGHFGLVVGVDRFGRPGDFLNNGAHLVVTDLGDLTLQ